MLNVNTDLILRAQKGDETVISKLYEHYHLRVFRYLYYRVGDRETAEDLTSEVFLRMLRFLGGFHPPSVTFQPWLFQIARNLANDYFRNSHAHTQVQLEENMIETTSVPEGITEKSLTSESLRQALNNLNDDQRDVIVLRFVAGMPITEVAQAMNKSEDAIKGLQRRGLASLRAILTDWEVSYVG